MLAIAGALGIAAAVGVHQRNLRRGVYQRIPIELIVILLLSAAAGLVALLRDGGAWRIGLFALEVLVLSATVLYLVLLSRFPRRQLSVRVGDRLPRFELPDSEGDRFDSSSMVGKAAALYLFYRGDW